MSNMENILTVVESNDEIEMINARDLYAALDIKTHYRDWIKHHVKSLNLVNGRDYIEIIPKLEAVSNCTKNEHKIGTGSGGHNIKYHGITATVALIIASGRKGEIGNMVKMHIKSILDNKLHDAITYKQSADLYLGSEHELTLADAAKMLGIPGFGQNKFKTWLRTSGYILEDDTPAQKEVSVGHMRLIFKEIPTGAHVPVILISKAGVDYYAKKLGLIKEKYLEIERQQTEGAKFILDM